MKRCHVYATAEEARTAIEAIDAARPSTEQATTYLGRRSTEAAIVAGLAQRTRRGTLLVTGAGLAEGYAVESGRLVRHHSIPARTWASVREVDDGRGGTRLVAGIPLADGTYAVPVCAEVAGTGEIPDDTTARTITRDDVLREAVAVEPETVDTKGGR